MRVIASGTNPVDAKLRQNGTWAGLRPPPVLGYDVAGIVDAVGDGVAGFSPGDEVYYTSGKKPLIDDVLPLAEVRRAHERLDSGHGTGKIVLRI